MNLPLDDVTTHPANAVVAIGGSAGALDALVEFFAALPERTGACFIVLQHLSPNHDSVLDELIAQHTNMDVEWIDGTEDLASDCVYLVPPRCSATLRGNTIHCADEGNGMPLAQPISRLFKSVGTELRAKSVCIVLSGTGGDGSAALPDVRDAGGLVMVQRPSSAQFDGMPASGIRTGAVDFVGAPRELASGLVAHLRNPSMPPEAPNPDAELDDPLDEVLDILERSYGVSFSQYKNASLQRRIQRRAAAVRARSLSEYVDHLQASETEVDLLFQDILITVTSFFRDPAAWNLLRQEVLLPLVRGGKDIRIWVAGCATGEEPASVAIALEELFAQHERTPNYRIFASDISPSALKKASAATFDTNAVAKLKMQQVDSHFDAKGLSFRLKEHIRQRILFSPHDLTKDAPFTNLDLVMCRNVLIYFQRNLQRRALGSLAFGLKTGGHLMLGASDTLTDDASVFSAVSSRWRLFRKERDFFRETFDQHVPRTTSRAPRRKAKGTSLLGVLSELAAGCLLLDGECRVVEVTGIARELLRAFPEAQTVLEQTTGAERAALEVLLASLQRDTSKIVRVALPGRGILLGQNIDVQGVCHTLVLLHEEPFEQVMPEEERLNKGGLLEASLAVTMQAKAVLAETIQNEAALAIDAAARISNLEAEVEVTRAKLRSVVEDLERSNEKLLSANEELRASNEALQSSNEELQVVNEELLTLNQEHQQKILEVLQVSDDLESFIESAKVATLFVDEARRIRKFTPALSEIIAVTPNDIGTPVRALSHEVPGLDLDELASLALSGTPRSDHQLSVPGGPTYLVRSLSKSAANRRPDGAAITLFDITETQAAQVRLTELLDQAHRDHLTGLLNRRGLEVELHKAQGQARRTLKPLFAILIDCDNFKGINDTLGYSVGDVVLREIALRFQRSFRPADLVARIGGDEFLAVLSGVRAAEAMQIAERCRLSISQLPVQAGHPVPATVSIGVAEIDLHDAGLDQVLRRSEGVVRRSKARGKNTTTRLGQDALDLHEQLTAIASGDGLWTAAQPFYNLRSGEVLGVELLTRGPGRYQNPQLLFEACQQAGVLNKLDLSCVERALTCAQPGECVHINILPSTLLETPPLQLEQLFDKPDAQICLELSEQQFIGAPSYLSPIVEKLKARGIGFAIDDVGFGQSALESLVLLEPDTVKIDRAFVSNVDTLDFKRMALKRLVQVAVALDCDVIAEGIESKSELDVLVELGVEQGQGFYWGKPYRVQPRT